MPTLPAPPAPSAPYTHGHAEAVLWSHRWRTANNSAAYLLPQLSPGMSLLDVGCGPGTLTADLAVRVAPGEVLGIDNAPEVVAEAQQCAARRGIGNLSVRVADLYTARLPVASFDVVHAHQVLQHVTDPVAALRRMGELAKPGGLIAARDSDYSAKTWAPKRPLLDRWLELYHQITRRNLAEADAGPHLLGWAQRAGLRDVVFTSSTWTFATPEDRLWWGQLWAQRVTQSRFAEQA
ncbi:MAG: class I SAM-dependent methyltransferase, partial [Mycobacteriales bacterium]